MKSQKLGDYLRSLRETEGYSTWALAERAECSQSLISAIENGERFPHLLRLWEILKILDGDFRQGLYYLCVDLGIPESDVEGILPEEMDENS
ncbi:MAG: helix-turn-helix domain-containing protein [Anaerolineae bacterium]|nr:helix-turn-helix domain-containing protein [Anaerolineae bacterium]MCB0190750.1 helix-turn-helix domain-containing protein [Anaerolineae bacterium]